MTLNSTIITAGYRESNFKGQKQTLTTEEQTEGLELLQSLVDSFFGVIIGTKAKPWWVPHTFHTAPEAANFPAIPGEGILRNNNDVDYPPPNSRVFLRNSAAQTIYFQMKPEDGALYQIVDAGFTADVTLDGNGMFIGDTGVGYTETINPQFGGGGRVTARTYVFRGDIASWVQTTGLSLTNECPFPSAFDDYFITALALRLAPRHGNSPLDVTVLRNKEMLTFIRGEYRQTEEAVLDGPRRASQNHYNGYPIDDPDRGRV